jgi:hypothetical protein
MDNKLAELEQAATYFDKMIVSAEKLSARWQKAVVALTAVIGVLVCAVVAIVAAFLLYLNQYDFTSTETVTYEASGIYALIDSDGNIIAEDVSQEDWQKFIEWWAVYGENQGDKDENPDAQADEGGR